MPSPVGADGVPDHVLLGGFAIGDANTGPAFVRRFQGRVYGMAINLLGDRGLAEEVAQEAFVRAWKHAATYDPERASVATWLLRITRNLAIDALRRRRPVALDPEMVAALTPAGPAITVEDATVTSDLAAQGLGLPSPAFLPGKPRPSGWPPSTATPPNRSPCPRASPSGQPRPGSDEACAPCEPSSPIPTRCNLRRSCRSNEPKTGLEATRRCAASHE